MDTHPKFLCHRPSLNRLGFGANMRGLDTIKPCFFQWLQRRLLDLSDDHGFANMPVKARRPRDLLRQNEAGTGQSCLLKKSSACEGRLHQRVVTHSEAAVKPINTR